ncbi:hypothetical protein RhiirC2_802758 [Rhizophagus irregularis]|uniref:Uncharacterized protein n=1 Tax=Rhizophagus irregularis TaxID=588596 RepID=A0A2N1M0Y6_9GLOM|nr:hypothetical protein RhiirC2_802758 [Rhizophagus irregularis]
MQNTDGLGRQDDESFHVWARRIQDTTQYYEACNRIRRDKEGRPSRPRSRQQIYSYIDQIRRIISRLPNYWYCTYYKDFMDHGWGGIFMDVQLSLYDGSEYFIFDYYNHRAEMIQKAFRRYIERKKNNKAARIIQKVAIPWLYRPGSPLIQKAKRRFYCLAVSQV